MKHPFCMLARAVPFILSLALMVLVVPGTLAQPQDGLKYTAVIESVSPAVQLEDEGKPPPDETTAWPRKMNLEFRIDENTPGPERQALESHLMNKASYRSAAGWPDVENLEEIRIPNPPFAIESVGKPTGLPDSKTSIYVTLHGKLSGRSRGTITIDAPANWKFVSLEGKELTSIRYSVHPQNELPRFTLDPKRLSFGSEQTYALEYSGEGILQKHSLNNAKTPSDIVKNARKPVTFAEFQLKLPLTKPGDVKDVAGANRDASKAIADAVQLGVKSVKYTRRGGLNELGVRARATATLKGAEVVGYYSPLAQLSKDNRLFGALELEAGWREGDAEWTNLTTRAPDVGNLVARLGTVMEWAPTLGGINRNLNPKQDGLKFFLRHRFWLDTYQNSSSDTGLRGRGYFDTELFYNFSNESRIYFRYEDGSLPPDLSNHVNRWSVGVGKAF